MSRTTIAIAGIAGSFSEEAAREFLRDSAIDGQSIYAVTAKANFEAISKHV